MKRIIIFLFHLLVTDSIYAQKDKDQHEVVADSFGQFIFDSSSLNLAQTGNDELQKFSKWYGSHSKEVLYHIYLSGLVTKSELEKDPFIGVKRCKIILYSLAKDGIDISVFFITNDKLQTEHSKVGVSFVIDGKSKVMLESTNEDDYFKQEKKNRKKN
jgi:hypothetical protein